MQLDDDVCLCFHVSKRKVINYIRNEKPFTASQLSQCFGAGTGCGWCRSYLEKLYKQLQVVSKSDNPPTVDSVEVCNEQTVESYALQRQDYLKNRSNSS